MAILVKNDDLCTVVMYIIIIFVYKDIFSSIINSILKLMQI